RNSDPNLLREKYPSSRKPEEVAKAALQLLSDAASLVNGRVIVSGGVVVAGKGVPAASIRPAAGKDKRERCSALAVALHFEIGRNGASHDPAREEAEPRVYADAGLAEGGGAEGSE